MSKGTSQGVFPDSHNGLFPRFRYNAGQQHADASRGVEISLKRDSATDNFRFTAHRWGLQGRGVQWGLSRRRCQRRRRQMDQRGQQGLWGMHVGGTRGQA